MALPTSELEFICNYVLSFVCDRIRFRDFVLFLLFPLDECTSGEEKKKT